MKNIAAGLVLYNPDLYRLKENIDSIIKQVKSVVLIDNGSLNIEEVKAELSNYRCVTIIKNDKNYGIGFALNQIIKFCIDNHFEWVLTLDQDTVVPKDIIKNYVKYITVGKVALICPKIQDRNDLIHDNNQNDDEIVFVKKCITSASLTNVEICKEIGLFDETMFIDLIDFDYCIRLSLMGYRILKVNTSIIIHQLGNLKIYNLLGKKIHVTNHSKERIYYYFRNSIYYSRKHKRIIRTKEIYWDLFKKICKINVFEKDKLNKMLYLLRGIEDGLKGRMGPLNDSMHTKQ